MMKVLFLVLGVFVFVQLFSQQNNSASRNNGKTVYTTFCMSCHMADGNGVPSAFPSLVQTGNLNNKNKLVKIILQGMRGPITVKGEKFNIEMAPINLTDQETADVINYIRNAWGNKAAMIKVSDVMAAKKAVVKGYQPF